MLFDRVLFDNEAWHITTGVLGIGICVHQKRRGLTRETTRYEQLFLLEVLAYMKGRGVPVESGCPEVEAIFESFAKALFVEERTAGDVRFLTTIPRDWADSVLAAR